MNSQHSLSILRAFLDKLEAEMGWQFNIDSFDDRLRLQKYVFLASSFGFEHPYSYGMHLRGPYSPPLAQDYYADWSSIKPEQSSVREFDVEHFVELVAHREVRWLEVAATLRAFSLRIKNKGEQADLAEQVIEKTMEEKDESRKYVEQVYQELNQIGVFEE